MFRHEEKAKTREVGRALDGGHRDGAGHRDNTRLYMEDSTGHWGYGIKVVGGTEA